MEQLTDNLGQTQSRVVQDDKKEDVTIVNISPCETDRIRRVKIHEPGFI